MTERQPGDGSLDGVSGIGRPELPSEPPPEASEPPAVQQLRTLAEAQASLRRLALLVAQGVAPDLIFAAVTKEVLRHFGLGTARLIRYEPDGSATLMANEGTSGPHVRVGEAWQGYPPEGITATTSRRGSPTSPNWWRSRWRTRIAGPS